MSDCVCLPTCIFFNDNMANMPAMAASMKKRYCQGTFSQCARYMVFSTLGKQYVPPDLFPNNVQRAQEIIKQQQE